MPIARFSLKKGNFALSSSLRGFWTGWLPNVCRNSVFNAAELATYDQVKQILVKKMKFSDSMFTHFFCGFWAGVMAVIVGNPIDVIKTRLMNVRISVIVRKQYFTRTDLTASSKSCQKKDHLRFTRAGPSISCGLLRSMSAFSSSWNNGERLFWGLLYETFFVIFLPSHLPLCPCVPLSVPL